MMVPTRRTVRLLGAMLPVALLPTLVEQAWLLWAALVGVLCAGLTAEWLLAAPARSMAVEARLPVALYVGERDMLRLVVRSSWHWRVPVEVVCDLDELLLAQPASRGIGDRAGGGFELALVPVRRGTTVLDAVWLRWSGPLGLLRWTVRRELGQKAPVLPNVRAVRGAALRFFGTRQFLAGLKTERYLGDGSEFDSLREHATGLDSRAIDWKATARHRKLLSREYRAERNHAVVLAIDSGRLMSEPMLGISKLDHGINAALLLAYVALKTGDRVGLFAFDESVRCYLAPQGGVQAFARIQRETAGIAYSHAETNFTVSLIDLGQRLVRRSLIVVLTDFVDTVTAELMMDNLARLGRDHLIVFVALRDVSLDALARKQPSALPDLHRAVAAHDIVCERDVVLGRLRRLGVHCIDAAPAEVTSRLVNAYADVKRRELL